MSWRRRLRRRLYWMLALAVLALAGRLPLRWGRACGRGLGRLALAVRPRDRALAAANLALALPERTEAGRRLLLRESAAALGGSLFANLAAGRVLDAPDQVAIAEAGAGRESLAEVLRRAMAPGRGLILLTCHLGAWELLGGWMARRFGELGLGPVAVVTGTIHNPAVDDLVQDRRRRLGLVVLPRRRGVRPVLSHLRRGGAVAVLLDQNLGPGEPIPFFGTPAPTASGLARIALRYGVPVLPVGIAWDGSRGRHVVAHLPALNAAPDGRVRPGALLQACNAALEELIRRNPEQWVWFHDRWGLRDG